MGLLSYGAPDGDFARDNLEDHYENITRCLCVAISRRRVKALSHKHFPALSLCTRLPEADT